MKQLNKIVQTLATEGAFTEQPVLFYGKTGMVVFFFHYAWLTCKELFADHAIELIEKANNQINDKTSMRYDIVISGIGKAVEYLLQKDLLEAKDSKLNLFEDFDDRMYRATMNDRYSRFSQEGSLTGFGRYFICRLLISAVHVDDKLFEELMQIVKTISKKNSIRLLKMNAPMYTVPFMT